MTSGWWNPRDRIGQNKNPLDRLRIGPNEQRSNFTTSRPFCTAANGQMPRRAAAALSRARGFARCRRLIHQLLLLVVLPVGRTDLLASGSIHTVHDKVTGCKITEQMFADGHGPWGLSGRSSVQINAVLRPLEDHEVQNAITIRRLEDYFDFGVVVVAYSAKTAAAVGFADRTACSWNFSTSRNVDGQVEGGFYPMESDEMLQVNQTFYPSDSGLQTALVVPCWKQKSVAFGYPVSADEYVAYPMADPLLQVDAAITFENPYGYLPGLLYGLLPFKYVLIPCLRVEA